MEKTSLWTGYVLQRTVDILRDEHFLDDAVEWVSLISDSGPHYRSSRSLAMMAKTYPERFQKHIAGTYGLEQHFKKRGPILIFRSWTKGSPMPQSSGP